MIVCFLKKKTARLAAVLVAAGVLGACEMTVPDPTLPEINYTGRMPYELNVGQLEIATTYNAPQRAPNIDHQMRVTPESELKRWAQSRLRPMGTEGIARYTIVDASMTETPVEGEGGIGAVFKKQADRRYDLTLRVTLQVLDDDRTVRAEVGAGAKHYRTVLEGSTVAERDRVQAELLKNAMEDINTQLDTGLRSHLHQWLMR